MTGGEADSCSGLEGKRHKGNWEEEQLDPHLLGCLQKIEKEGEFSDIEKNEASRGSKSQTSIERGGQ
jgi:hypothetical protein